MKPSSLAYVSLLSIALIAVALVLLPSSSKAAKANLNEASVQAATSAPDLTWISGGHAGGVGKAALSPDGQILATADYAEVYLWRYSDGQLLGTIGMAGVDTVNCIKFTPDGQYVVAGGSWIPGYPGNPSTLRVWRVSDRSLVRQFDLHSSVGSFALSADGHFIVAGHGYESVLVLDFNTGATLQTLGPFAYTAVAISPDGSMAAATGADHFGDPPSVNVWRRSDGTLITKLTGLSFISNSIAFSPDGQYLAAGDWGGNGTHGKVIVWQANGENFTPIQSLTTQLTSSIYSLAFSPDSQTIAAGGVDDELWLWHLPDGSLTQSISVNFNNAIWNIIFSDNNTIFVGGAKNVSDILRASDGAWLREIGGNREFVTAVAFSPDGKYFAADNGSVGGGGNFWVQMFQSDTGEGVRAFPIHEDIINSVAFSPDGQLLASASGSQPPDTRDTRIFIARVSNGLQQLVLPGHAGGTTSIAFSPDSQLLASGGRDNVLALWRVSDGAVLRYVRGHSNWVQSVAFSPDGQTIASGGDSTVKLWNVSDLSLIRTIPGNGYPVGSISFSPDGQTLALTTYSAIQLWRVSDGTLLRTMYVEAGVTNLGNVVFSRDGSVVMVADGSYPPTIWFWRVSDGAVLQTYKQETGWVQPPVLAVSPDNTQLGIGRYDSIVEMARFSISNASSYTPNYEGNDEATDCNSISGWAWDSNQPDGIVNVDIYDGQTFLATIPANNFRQDLYVAGKGSGYHGFSYTIPASFKNGTPHNFGVRVSGTSTELVNSPRSVTCGSPPPPPPSSNSGTWTTAPPMPTARQGFAVGVINGKLYAVGGDSTIGPGYGGVTPNPLNTLEVYDPATNAWSTLAPMPTARFGLTAGVINGKLYAVGGFNSGYLRTLEAYDPATNTWSTLAPMPAARYEMAAEVIDGNLYVAGGYDPAGNSNTLQVYDPATNFWSTWSPMPLGRYRLAATVISGKLYAVAGSPFSTNSSSLQAFDPSTNTWAVMADLSMGLDSLAAGAINGKLYTVGGTSSTGPTNAVNVYNPTTSAWSSVVAMPTARKLLAAGVINGKLYALGGINSNKVVLNTMEVLTPAQSISGHVTNSSSHSGLAGVTLTISGGTQATVTTDQNGYYSFTNLPAGANYGITPTMSGYTFTPQNPVVRGLSTDEVMNFQASTAPTAAPASISGRVINADGTSLAGVTIMLNAARMAITDANGQYSFDNLEAGGFYTVTPRFVNYSFNPQSRAFSLVSGRTDAVFTAAPDSTQTENPLDTSEYFVREQYLDFLGREPDEGGFNYWSTRINECAGDADCVRQRRIDVSAAYFFSQEFQDTGSFVYRLYKAGLSRRLSYAEFNSDRGQVLAGTDMYARRVAFADSFVERPEFIQKYNNATTAEGFVDALLRNIEQVSSVDLSARRDSLIAKYNSGQNIAESRSLALREAIDDAAFKSAENNRSFVLMQYYGYLRRDVDEGGYQFWLDVLSNRVAGNYRSMVCAFITSTEYQRRFSSVATHSNSECR
ncbi:MAG: hypothetical protein AUG51_13600 [Acidobacteria bacterium 13_1_20CM_3_53_8]|nr:MAG: hypothetical protein AUG51_13600 [Acidobacteria bacterium 13_1_20CM_3_53_8]